MNTPITVRGGAVLVAVLLAAGLAACDKPAPEQTAGQKVDAAIGQVQQAADQAKSDAKDAAATAQADVQSSAQKASDSIKQGADAVMAQADDLAVQAKIVAALAQEPSLSAIKIEVKASNGVVTLGGPVPSSQAKERATEVAKAVKGVTSVQNNLTVTAG
ncbi:MAG TPA: BON domain-containing protein [Burkholderiaceae bacterium]